MGGAIARDALQFSGSRIRRVLRVLTDIFGQGAMSYMILSTFPCNLQIARIRRRCACGRY
ncbi:hypothetical protein ACMFMG_012244 [Clarireedia jacksonii]